MNEDKLYIVPETNVCLRYTETSKLIQLQHYLEIIKMIYILANHLYHIKVIFGECVLFFFFYLIRFFFFQNLTFCVCMSFHWGKGRKKFFDYFSFEWLHKVMTCLWQLEQVLFLKVRLFLKNFFLFIFLPRIVCFILLDYI